MTEVWEYQGENYDFKFLNSDLNINTLIVYHPSGEVKTSFFFVDELNILIFPEKFGFTWDELDKKSKELDLTGQPTDVDIDHVRVFLESQGKINSKMIESSILRFFVNRKKEQLNSLISLIPDNSNRDTKPL